MAEGIFDDSFDEEKLELIGSLIARVESILSPKPINVWNIPGALEKTLSSVLLILSHGCKEDSERNLRLWSFIFGLRVIRPDLWPNYEIKYSAGNLSIEELVTLWLQISLQSHLLSNQLKSLVEDRKRLHNYYYPWSFLRSRKYTNSLLIALQSLEQNSQDLLATLNPSLMVKYYSKKKKDQLKKTFSHDNEESKVSKKADIKVCVEEISFTNNHLKKTKESQTENDVINYLSTWEDDLNLSSSKLSPSFFKIDYNNSASSDGEKIDPENKVEKESSQCQKNEETKLIMPKENDHHLSIHNKKYLNSSKILSKRRSSLQEGSNFLKSRTQYCDIDTSSPCLNGMEDQELSRAFNEILSCQSDLVRPSPFLLKYLSSKSRLDKNVIKPKEVIETIEENSSHKPIISSNDIQIKLLEVDDPHAKNTQRLNSSNAKNTSDKHLPVKTTLSVPSLNKGKKASLCEKPIVRSHIRSHSDGVKSIITEASSLTPASASFSDKSSSSSHISCKSLIKKRFMEDGGKSITQEADGFFPHPRPGQTLIDFLASDQFAKASAQLDRENAHFSIAEAVLAAIEQMNYDTGQKTNKSTRAFPPDESEDDLATRKVLPFNRRKLRARSRIPFSNQTSDEDPLTTDYSIFDSPEPQSSDSSDTDTIPSFNESQNKPIDEDVPENQSSSTADPSSAENVAIAILMHYNSRLLPKASELQWLVSEKEAPQELLPIPTSVAISPDDAEGKTSKPLLRGTSDWAPPRPQLILTLHKNTKRKARLIAQKWRCAGCGLVVSERLSGHFRLCHYLGRFFCTNCHTNKKAIVPAKVLHRWDFKKYSVCNFSYELLSRMSPDPLFHLGTLSPRLYRQSRDLHQTHIYRLQLFHARIYILTCTRASKEKALLESVPQHWCTEPHVYSMDDLISVKKSQIMHQIKNLTTSCVTHISHCQICLGQGFICEICREGNPIFPFQLDAVTQCTKCKECFHFLCFSPNRSCPRCERREKRESKEGTINK